MTSIYSLLQGQISLGIPILYCDCIVVTDRQYQNHTFTVECLTVPLWYKQQVTFLNPKFD